MLSVPIMGVDLASNVFQVHGPAADGSVQFRKAVRSAFCCQSRLNQMPAQTFSRIN